VIVIGQVPPINAVLPMVVPSVLAGTVCIVAVPTEAPAVEYVTVIEPFITVNTWNLLSDGEGLPPLIVPPLDELQVPLVTVRHPGATVTATFVPSGTVLPAESLMPEKVTVAVPPADRESEEGPEPVADVVPCRRIVPIPTTLLVSVLPLLEAGTTET
jgi:hypothetical protein